MTETFPTPANDEISVLDSRHFPKQIFSFLESRVVWKGVVHGGFVQAARTDGPKVMRSSKVPSPPPDTAVTVPYFSPIQLSGSRRTKLTLS